MLITGRMTPGRYRLRTLPGENRICQTTHNLTGRSKVPSPVILLFVVFKEEMVHNLLVSIPKRIVHERFSEDRPARIPISRDPEDVIISPSVRILAACLDCSSISCALGSRLHDGELISRSIRFVVMDH